MAHGLDAKNLEKQIKSIEKLNDKIKGITILKGIGVDILKDGSLDLPEDILKELDVVVCSVHYDRNLSKKQMTERIIRAMDHPYFNILAHPTGRLINERAPYEVDPEKVIEKAREAGCFLEINAHPDRLDLSDRYCRMAKEAGAKLVISTDAHRTGEEKLAVLTEALAKRPGLRLRIQGGYALEADLPALKSLLMRSRLAAKKPQAVKPGEGEGPVVFHSVETQKALEALFLEQNPSEALDSLREEFRKNRLAGTKGQGENRQAAAWAPFYEELYRRMEEKMEISKSRLDALAEARAAGVRQFLVSARGLDPGRVEVLEPVKTSTEGKQVAIKLSLGTSG